MLIIANRQFGFVTKKAKQHNISHEFKQQNLKQLIISTNTFQKYYPKHNILCIFYKDSSKTWIYISNFAAPKYLLPESQGKKRARNSSMTRRSIESSCDVGRIKTLINRNQNKPPQNKICNPVSIHKFEAVAEGRS